MKVCLLFCLEMYFDFLPLCWMMNASQPTLHPKAKVNILLKLFVSFITLQT